MKITLPGSTSKKYSESLPVITEALIQEWRANENVAKFAEHIRLSNEPDVFRHFQNHNNDVAIWRNDLPKPVINFVSTALGKLGSTAASIFAAMWKSAGTLTLDDRNLVGSFATVNIETITNLYIPFGIHPNLTIPFADFFLTSLKNVLLNLPAQTKLKNVTISENFQYVAYPSQDILLHEDGVATLILNFSDPGTPYFMGKHHDPEREHVGHNMYKEKICSEYTGNLYRTGVSDFVMHGADVLHGFASAAPSTSQMYRPRFMSVFKLDYRR